MGDRLRSGVGWHTQDCRGQSADSGLGMGYQLTPESEWEVGSGLRIELRAITLIWGSIVTPFKWTWRALKHKNKFYTNLLVNGSIWILESLRLINLEADFLMPLQILLLLQSHAFLASDISVLPCGPVMLASCQLHLNQGPTPWPPSYLFLFCREEPRQSLPRTLILSSPISLGDRNVLWALSKDTVRV